MNDFEYIDHIFSVLVEKEQHQGKNSLTHQERVFIETLHAYGLLQNGGLEHFFVWEDANPVVADFFDELGLTGMAEVIRKFFALFPTVDFPCLGSSQRDALLEAKFSTIEDRIEELNDQLLSNLRGEDIDGYLLRFIKENNLGDMSDNLQS